MAINELIQNNPRIAIIILSFIVTLFITIVTYYMTDREKMKEIKARQKELRKEMKQFRDNPDKMLELNKKMMEDMPEQLKLSMRPMMVTFIPIIIFFGWLRATFNATSLGGGTWFFGWPVWIFWYIGFSILFSIGIRKTFGLQ